MGEKTGSAAETRVSPCEGGTPQNGLHGRPVANPGGGRPPLFLDQNEARRAEKNFFEAAPTLSEGLDPSL